MTSHHFVYICIGNGWVSNIFFSLNVFPVNLVGEVTQGLVTPASSASLVSFRNNANSQFGYLASADTQAITTGIVGYNTSTGNLTISSVIDGGSF